MTDGVRTPYITPSSILAEVLGNHDGSTVRVSLEELAQLLGVFIGPGVRPGFQKWIATADWQPKPIHGQEDNARAMMDDIVARHADATAVVFAGDIVDRASMNRDGAPPPYGYPEFLTDWHQRRLPRLQPLPGNHDRDGTRQTASGGNAHERSWTYRTYREHLGPEFYHVRRGNTAWVMLGDMAGSTFGEITKQALEWFRETLISLAGCNIFVVSHQPIGWITDSEERISTGGWIPTNGPPGATSYHRASQQLAGIIAQHDNIACVFYGHVGRDYPNSTQVREFAGTLHIGVQVGLERVQRAENGGTITDWPWHYGVLQCAAGASEMAFHREDARTQMPIPGSELTIPLRYPVSLLSSDDFRGDIAAQTNQPMLRGPVTVYADTSDRRIPDSGEDWTYPPGIISPLTVAMTEIALDNLVAGDGTGIDIVIPGAVSNRLSTIDGETVVPTGPDDVDEESAFPTFADFPATGELGVWYLALDTEEFYYWDGSEYVNAPSQRLVTSEPGSGMGARIAASKVSGADDNFSAYLDLYASGPGEGEDSLVHFARGRPDGVLDALNGIQAEVLNSAHHLDAIGDTPVATDFIKAFCYTSGNAPAGAPQAAFAQVLHIQRNSRLDGSTSTRTGSRSQLILQSAGAQRIWYRALTGGVYSANHQVYHSGTVVGEVSHDNGAVTGAVIEGPIETPDGWYQRFAGGLQIAWNASGLTDDPADFVGTPVSLDGDKLRIGQWHD